MKFADLQKGVTYWAYRQNDTAEAMMSRPNEKHPAFVLSKYVVTKLGEQRVEVRRLLGKKQDRLSQPTTYHVRYGHVPIHATPLDAKRALVNALTEELRSVSLKEKRLKEELNEALLYEVPHRRPDVSH